MKGGPSICFLKEVEFTEGFYAVGKSGCMAEMREGSVAVPFSRKRIWCANGGLALPRSALDL